MEQKGEKDGEKDQSEATVSFLLKVLQNEIEIETSWL